MVLYSKIISTLLAGFLSLFLFFLTPSFADCFSTDWPHEQSNLSPDPGLIFGRLDNGFRYVLMKNAEPKNRVAMSLNVQAGSLNETDKQQGIAHFLEHMLFNGTTHFPPGKLVEYFQSLGMSFGGDTNAHTGYDETVYDIVLPDGNKNDIEKALLVFADYARGALLLQTEIDRERGVILAEKRSRDSAGYRAHVKETAFSMKGTLLPVRMPIGTLETLQRANHPIMKSFYDAWYRPNNMVLVVVGDFDPQNIKSLIDNYFSDLSAGAKTPECPDIGRIDRDDLEFYYHHESEMGTTEISIESMWNVEGENDSISLQVKELTRHVGNKILQYRLDELLTRSDTPFTAANTYSGIFMGQFAYASIAAESNPEKWEESLAVIDKTLRQALDYGFTEEELKRVKKELLMELDSAVLTAGSRNSKVLASSIIRKINSNRVIQSPEQERELLAPALKKMSLTDVESLFRKDWEHPGRMVKLSGNALIPGEDPLLTLAESYRHAEEMIINGYEGEKAQVFPYLHFKKNAHKNTEQIKLPIKDSIRYVFDNNIILNLKNTSFHENELLISADFGLGEISSPTPGLARLSEAVLGQSGTGTLNRTTLDKIIGASSVKIDFVVTPAAFSWRGKVLSKDVELFFQLLQSLLSDPGIDRGAFKNSMEQFKQSYGEMRNDMRGAMALQGERFLAGGDPFFGLPSWAEFSEIRMEQIREWIFPAAMSGELEVTIVGDFDKNKVLELAEKYFSVLPERTQEAVQERVVSFPEGKKLELTIPSSIDKGLLVFAWKTDDFWDIKRTRGLHLLAGIFSDKLRRVIREKLGASYSPQVYNRSSKIYKDYGVMKAILVVNPSQVEMLKEEVLKISGELWQGNISDAELERVKGPMLTSLKDMLRQNNYWLTSVLALSSRNAEQLMWPRTILSEFENYPLEDIKSLSKKYLKPEKAAIIRIIPE